ncbi:hypothetical protein ACFDR8_000132 [Arthrobacter sp. MP_2.3]
MRLTNKGLHDILFPDSEYPGRFHEAAGGGTLHELNVHAAGSSVRQKPFPAGTAGTAGRPCVVSHGAVSHGTDR